MLSRLIEFSLRQRLLVLLAVLALAGAGVASFLQLPIDAYPDISPTQVKLILKAPGMTPEEVESRVIAPLEMELLGVPRGVMLRSTAKYAIADITLDFAEGSDIYWARQQVAERYAAVAGSLPEGVGGGLAPISTPLSDVFMFTIEGGSLSLSERRTLLDWTLRPALRTLPGVADINVLGGEAASFAVVPDRARLSAAGMSFADVVTAVSRNNRNDGAGRLDAGENTLIVRSEGAIRSAEDVSRIVLRAATAGAPAVRVGDVAAVRMEGLTRYGAVSRDGQGEAVEGIVVALRGADASTLVKAIRARLDELAPSLPPGVKVVPFYDRSTLIQRAVGTVESALLEATVLVVVLLLLFLGELRAALVVALMVPLAALGTFLLMRVAGMSANLMSLGGLAIAIGMLVDAAVVVVENAVSRLDPHADGAQLPRLHRVFAAAREVALPVASGILIICLTFVPLLALQGLEGKLFAPVALTIVFALGVSLLLSLTLVPVLSSLLLEEHAHREPWVMRGALRLYRPMLDAALAHPLRATAMALAALVLGVLAYLGTGKAFMPTMDEGDILLQLQKPPSIGLNRSRDIDLAVQKAILEKVPEVQHSIARVGSDELGLDPMGLNETDMFMQLGDRKTWRMDKEALGEEIRKVMAAFPGLDFGFTQPIEMRVSEMLTGSRGDVAIKLFGPDLNTLGELAVRIAASVEKVPGARDVLTQASDHVEYLQVKVDAQASGRAGLAVAAVQDELRAQLEGVPAGMVIEANRRTPIVVRGDAPLRGSAERFKDLRLARSGAAGSGDIPLTSLAAITTTQGPVLVRRESGSRFALIQSMVSGRDLVGFVDEARAVVARDVSLPAGYRLEWGGQFENQQRAAARLGLVVPVSLALIFFVLFMTFGSTRQAVLILGNVPFALVGGMAALWMSGQYLSVPASVGFIALLGIAVLNGLVLVTHFNHLHALGLPMDQVVREGSLRRLRPVLMTASITAFGLVPLLLSTGPGSEIQRPLAIVVIGGLVSSTALTLVLLPVLYRRFGQTMKGGTA
ncbi:efflux RND transporter permease subunit [Alicycliphilus denitrificans]|uniref:Efflux RND transporter permease subunit n=1 Tax=Alicycliphilus denitrificans TaxID=179636 RepID=A0A858ZWZ7_9BURK|nr:CusA/CzcA family heavy metal efflux RND transporter [Alicycliphilus denitrificans]ADV01190.1 heavy metal efflux pump, CzcA family [Alicycliphilus denitrificans BC]QKD45338.1 efflux RND transporter permease subunit [Alicycliphilus denitrificans]GAO24814.1 heavy metal efflux system protein [Alicycliphilus sp. B1]